MMLIVGVVVVLTAAVVLRRMRAAGRFDPDQLGRMSDDWLAEHYG
jgi:hypothetical protein